MELTSGVWPLPPGYVLSMLRYYVVEHAHENRGQVNVVDGILSMPTRRYKTCHYSWTSSDQLVSVAPRLAQTLVHRSTNLCTRSVV